MDDAAARPRRPAVLLALGAAAVLLCSAFTALGVWQVQRLGWKLDLIARVDRQLQAAPGPLPPLADWPRVGRDDEYRRVQLHGHWDAGRETLVLASTELGRGWWVLTPLQLDGGGWVLVNRGYVPSELKGRIPPAQDTGGVGLLRLSEPGGSLLQSNDPAGDRWFSRDVPAIAAARGLHGPVAPFFVDLQSAPGAQASAWPRPGLTVLRFANNHLGYALTWFALAAMVAGGYGYLLVHERRQRRLATVQARADHRSA